MNKIVTWAVLASKYTPHRRYEASGGVAGDVRRIEARCTHSLVWLICLTHSLLLPRDQLLFSQKNILIFYSFPQRWISIHLFSPLNFYLFIQRRLLLTLSTKLFNHKYTMIVTTKAGKPKHQYLLLLWNMLYGKYSRCGRMQQRCNYRSTLWAGNWRREVETAR